jgi:tripartite-type tricarboxylate transporter receptor subunit TctC
MAALISGEVNMYLVASASSVIPLIEAGRVKPLGVSVKSRLPVLPQLPAMAETIPGYDVAGWNGILAPAGTPQPIIDQLQREIAKAVHSPQFTQLLEREGATGVASTPAEFAVVIQDDIDRWAKLLKGIGVKPE